MSRHSMSYTVDRRSNEPARHWHHDAYCRDQDPELHFPIGNSGPALIQIEQAKANCRRCPVKARCLAWALDNAPFGVWGGMSEDERRELKEQRVKAEVAA